MNYLLLIALLTSTLTQAQSYEVVTESETSTTYELAARAGQPDHQTRAHMLSAGECWQFRDKMDDWSTCEPHCGYKMGEGPMGCSAVLGIEYYRFTNDAGEYYNPGRCLCRDDGLDFVEAILGIVLEGLAEFGKFTCEWILPAISLTIDVGLNFVPGGAASNIALKSSIRVAKYLDRNGYGADAFGSWYSDQCGDIDPKIPTHIPGLTDVWQEWADVPDDVIPGGVCVKGNKKCKKNNKKDDEDKKKKEEEEKRKKEEEEKRKKEEEEKRKKEEEEKRKKEEEEKKKKEEEKKKKEEEEKRKKEEQRKKKEEEQEERKKKTTSKMPQTSAQTKSSTVPISTPVSTFTVTDPTTFSTMTASRNGTTSREPPGTKTADWTLVATGSFSAPFNSTTTAYNFKWH